MPVPAATYISQLDPTQPTGTSKKYEGDDWFRLLQFVLQSQFPNLGVTAVTAAAADLNTITRAIRVQSPETPPTFPLIAARANRLMAFDASGNFDTTRTLAQFDLDVSNTATNAFNAGQAANSAGTSAFNAGQSESNAGTSAFNAAGSATLSQNWAVSPTIVAGIDDSSKTWAGRAANSATSAAASALQAGASLTGTSTTSIPLATGSVAFTSQANKAWLPNSTRLNFGSAGTAGASVRGTLTAYNPSTGAGTILIDGFTGVAGNSYADWNISPVGFDAPSSAAVPDFILQALGVY